MHRVYNYGSFLQAYALKKIIESLGHEVVFVDYKVDRPLIRSKRELINYYKGVLNKYIFKAIDNNAIAIKTKILPPDLRYAAKSHYAYQTSYWKFLGLDDERHYQTNVDLLVIGSDEVFNCLQRNVNVGYSRELFGANSQAKKIITYAASFGNTTEQGLRDAGIWELVKKDFSRFSAISVRDNNSLDISHKLTGRDDIIENFDPVLIHDFSELQIEEFDLTDYIIVYAYRGRLTDEEINVIKQFADMKRKKIVCIGGYHSFCDIYIQDSPLEIFKYFKNADYVITDTFHGTIFSVINHANVGVFVRDGHGKTYGNSEKLVDLLRKLGLENRVIKSLDSMGKVLEKKIDYEKVDSIIKSERVKTIEYLNKQLSLEG